MLEITTMEHHTEYLHVEVSSPFELRVPKALYGDILDECFKSGLSNV